MTERVLYVVTCGTLAAARVHELVALAQADDWHVCVIATPSAVDFIDIPALVTLTGHPVRTHYKRPGQADALPKATAMIVAGASFNTINKWAAGISDTLALGLLNEAIGLRLPLVLVPFVNSALGAHPAFAASLQRLRDVGVEVLFTRGELHEPGRGPELLDELPWQAALGAVSRQRSTGMPGPNWVSTSPGSNGALHSAHCRC